MHLRTHSKSNSVSLDNTNEINLNKIDLRKSYFYQITVIKELKQKEKGKNKKQQQSVGKKSRLLLKINLGKGLAV